MRQRTDKIRVVGTPAVSTLNWIFGTPSATAQTDEIEVYNAEIAAPGVFNLTVHDNYKQSPKCSPIIW
jgi:hypothetical protein